MAERVPALIGSTSYALVLRIMQFIFAGLVLGLAAYTASVTRGWGEAWFAVATVSSPIIRQKI
jgi:hypothetical protein